MVSSSFIQFFQKELSRIKGQNRFRSLLVLEGPVGPTIRINGRSLLLFASNDYLGLAAHPLMIRKTKEAIEQYGTGMGASRLVSGNHRLHHRLEQEMAAFKESEAALVFSSGYLTHLGTIPALAGEDDLIFSDSLNHASIVDACRLSRAQVVIYPHLQMEVLESRLRSAQRKPGSKVLIVTDGVFSMDGDLAPLPDLLRLARKYEALVLVDDAHATGVLGPGGKGSAAFWKMPAQDLLTMGTFSKALGCLGGFISGPEIMVAFLRNKARTLIYSTALPPSVCASGLTALGILQEEPLWLDRLRENMAYFQKGLETLGIDPQPCSVPIFSIITGTEEKTLAVSKALWEEGIFIPAIRPPTVPENESRLRISLMATHTKEHLDILLDALGKVF
ncbi:MAG: 8-amino-7-oxononanoate synthase [Deltaproteobacteria bacterium]|nr:8-amino-7-oxononanoate synthase [Deltaproteobacteria bacterium]